jgi:hypothetical protein
MGARGRDRREGRTGQKVQRLVGDAWAAGGARARKNYAGTSPITRASGKKKVVLARYVRNKRLADVLHHQVFSALNVSPGARAYYDALRDRDIGYNAALRRLGNRLVGILHGCLKTHTPYNEALAWHQHTEQEAA